LPAVKLWEKQKESKFELLQSFVQLLPASFIRESALGFETVSFLYDLGVRAAPGIFELACLPKHPDMVLFINLLVRATVCSFPLRPEKFTPTEYEMEQSTPTYSLFRSRLKLR
jgi:hypothetical protein